MKSRTSILTNTDRYILDFNLLKIKIFKTLERAGILLKVYRSGKIPKIIKLFFLSKNFEDLIWFLRPDRWSLKGLYLISKLFTKTSRNPTKRLMSLVFLPRIQEYIFKNKFSSICVDLIFGMISSNFKSFFLSVVLPFYTSLNCSKKESIVVSLISVKINYCPKDLEWLLLKILKVPQILGKCIVLRTILTKNYKLSYKTLDVLVDFFIRYKKNLKKIIFLKCYIAFLKNYSYFLSFEDKKRVTFF